jgi:hypothetical protein
MPRRQGQAQIRQNRRKGTPAIPRARFFRAKKEQRQEMPVKPVLIGRQRRRHKQTTGSHHRDLNCAVKNPPHHPFAFRKISAILRQM